jgi:CDGSH-type Zn-finger protein
MEKGIKITTNGPYEVFDLPLSEGIIKTDDEGYPIKVEKTKDYPQQKTYFLCRCGESLNKPFCDGAHTKIRFNGSETAERENFERMADVVEGPNVILNDTIPLCSGAGFCHGKEGNTWDLIQSEDKKSNEMGIKQACNCNSGRLVVIDKKTNKPIESEFTPSIMILKEPLKKVGSSIWVIGNVPIISGNGQKYEIRNRVTLCRCGKSAFKPFCDAAHRYFNFKDD